MMTAQQLKNSILQRAIEGKLVEQRAEEGTAKELLKEIKLEKEKLVKEGKIKKSKPLPPITEDEIPFDIPDSWEWVRLADICIKLVDGDHNPPKGEQEKTDYIMASSQNINDDTLVDLDKVRYLSKEVFDKENLRTNAEKGDIFFTSVGTLGKSCVFNGSENICFQRSVTVLSTLIFNYYLKVVLDSPEYQNMVKKRATGTAQKGFYLNQMSVSLIPIPPLSEQNRIVAKIEELMPLVDQYDKAYSQLTVLNEKFHQDMKKSILQYAIEGKLVEQRPEEGTAKELLKEIKLEKEKLIKEGKIKKSKPLPPITEDEIPFDIPENWEWVRLGEIVTVCGGKRIPAGTQLTTKNTGHKYIRVSDMKNGTVLLDDIKFVTDDIYEKISRYTISVDDVYITVAGTIGSVGTIPSELNNANLTENADKLLIYRLNQKFMVHLLSSAVIQTQIKEATTKVGQPKLAIKRIEMLYIPLPPLSEQYRIVAKIEELMPLCDKLVKTK